MNAIKKTAQNQSSCAAYRAVLAINRLPSSWGLYVFPSLRMCDMGFQLALVCTLKHARDAGKIASREAMCAMKQLSLPVISWG